MKLSLTSVLERLMVLFFERESVLIWTILIAGIKVSQYITGRLQRVMLGHVLLESHDLYFDFFMAFASSNFAASDF